MYVGQQIKQVEIHKLKVIENIDRAEKSKAKS